MLGAVELGAARDFVAGVCHDVFGFGGFGSGRGGHCDGLES